MPFNAESEIKQLDQRLAKLENVVKVQAETRTASKVEAVEKTLKALEAAKLIDQNSFNKAMKENDEKRIAQQNAAAKKQADELDRSAKDYVQKAVADAQKQNDALRLEARIQVLEARLKALEAQANR